jgi:hypothetical protein
MAVQWTRHIRSLCDVDGAFRYYDILTDTIAALDKAGRSSEKQSQWFINQLGLHYGTQVQHVGPIALTVAQKRSLNEAVSESFNGLTEQQLEGVRERFSHRFHGKSTSSSHRIHEKSANSTAKSTDYARAITILLTKLNNWQSPQVAQMPMASLNWPSAIQSPAAINAGSLEAHQPIANDVAAPLAPMPMTFVEANAAAPLRGLENQSRERDGVTKTAERKSRKVRENAACVSLWVDRKPRGTVRGYLEIGTEKFRLCFRGPRTVEDYLYVAQDGEPDEREFYEYCQRDILSMAIKRNDGADPFEAGHCISAIHEMDDTKCKAQGVPFGVALLKFKDSHPGNCIVEFRGVIYQVKLLPQIRKYKSSPTHKGFAPLQPAEAA